MKYLLVATYLFLAQTTFACSLGPDADLFKTASENYPNYTYVVSGTITAKTEMGPEGSQYEFTITGDHKNNVETDTAILASAGHSCGYFGSVGQHMLFFSNDLKTINEWDPKYNYDSAQLAYQAGLELQPQQPKTETPTSCTKEYRPVCAALQVQCVQAPCPPVETTYSNRCLADAANAEFLYQGTCKTDFKNSTPEQAPPKETLQVPTSAPTENPTDNFVGPTSPPPYDNSIEIQQDKPASWWRQFIAWITRVLSF